LGVSGLLSLKVTLGKWWKLDKTGRPGGGASRWELGAGSWELVKQKEAEAGDAREKEC
jgi:hypothetical protein